MKLDTIESTPRAVQYQYVTPREYLSGLPIIESEHAQLGRGSSEVRATVFVGRDLIYSISYSQPKRASSILIEPQWLLLMLPLSWEGEFLFNGRAVEKHDLLQNSNRECFSFTAEDRKLINIGLRKSRLISILRALTGRHDDDFRLGNQVIRLRPEVMSYIRHTLLAAIAAGGVTPLSHGRLLLPDTVESQLLLELSKVVLSHVDCDQSVEPWRMGALRTVRAAQCAYENLPPERVMLDDLCRSAGVGKVWLHKCFVEIYGTSPMSFQRARLLMEARMRLLDRDSPPRSIKDVSFSLGFMNSGRFASDYHALFGEIPSDTLRGR